MAMTTPTHAETVRPLYDRIDLLMERAERELSRLDVVLNENREQRTADDAATETGDDNGA